MFKFKISIFFLIFQFIKIWFYANIRHLSDSRFLQVQAKFVEKSSKFIQISNFFV